MTKLLCFFLSAVLLFAVSGCSSEEEPIEPGSICTIRNGEGKFQVVKVLAINDSEAHIMVFKNTYDQRPASIGPEDLQLSDIGDSEDEQLGIPHVAMTRSEFDNRIPVVVAFEQVVEEDLKAYNAWKKEHPGH